MQTVFWMCRLLNKGSGVSTQQISGSWASHRWLIVREEWWQDLHLEVLVTSFRGLCCPNCPPGRHFAFCNSFNMLEELAWKMCLWLDASGDGAALRWWVMQITRPRSLPAKLPWTAPVWCKNTSLTKPWPFRLVPWWCIPSALRSSQWSVTTFNGLGVNGHRSVSRINSDWHMEHRWCCHRRHRRQAKFLLIAINGRCMLSESIKPYLFVARYRRRMPRHCRDCLTSLIYNWSWLCAGPMPVWQGRHCKSQMWSGWIWLKAKPCSVAVFPPIFWDYYINRCWPYLFWKQHWLDHARAASVFVCNLFTTRFIFHSRPEEAFDCGLNPFTKSWHPIKVTSVGIFVEWPFFSSRGAEPRLKLVSFEAGGEPDFVQVKCCLLFKMFKAITHHKHIQGPLWLDDLDADGWWTQSCHSPVIPSASQIPNCFWSDVLHQQLHSSSLCRGKYSIPPVRESLQCDWLQLARRCPASRKIVALLPKAARQVVTVPKGEKSKRIIEEREIEWNGVAVPFFFPQDAQSLASKLRPCSAQCF